MNDDILRRFGGLLLALKAKHLGFSLCQRSPVAFCQRIWSPFWMSAGITSQIALKSLKMCNSCHPSAQQSLLSTLLLFNGSVMSDSLRRHGLQHARLSCPSPSPGACSNSFPLSGWCHPTISSCQPFFLLPSIFPSIRVFSKGSILCIRWPKYWSFSISPSNEYSGLISFRIDWFDLFAVQGTLKSLLQHHSSKSSIIWCSTKYYFVPNIVLIQQWTQQTQISDLIGFIF